MLLHFLQEYISIEVHQENLRMSLVLSKNEE